jgi:capsular polysaccharide biosynthesis protein
VYGVPNVTLLGGNAVALSDDGAFILEEILRNEKLLGASLADIVFDNPKYAFSYVMNRETTNKIECAASLINLGGYYHWFMSFLPRLQGIQAYEKATGLSPTILIRPDPPEWMKTSLKLIGYWDQAVEWDGGTTRVHQFIIPTIPREETPSGDRVYSPFLVKNMRNRILASVDLNSQNDFSRHVYISRGDASTRRVINKRELFSALPGSFESYCLSELSLIDQMRLFSTAETVVAPHGAGLVNMLWGSDIDIVELYGVVGNSSFFQLAQTLGHTYTCIPCEQDGRDLIVDPDTLRRRINCLLSN